jgi:release factor glutamine methyltransferase
VVAAEEEADELLAAAGSAAELAAMLARRLDGEPTAWITGRTTFLGIGLGVDAGVYVPRWKTEAVARHALAHLPVGGNAVDLCTGSGAIAAFLARHRPNARVVGTDIDPLAVACARSNGVEAYAGNLFDPVPQELLGTLDLVVAVPPYVPDAMLRFLPRDVVAHEPAHALAGGGDGLVVAEQLVSSSVDWLHHDGSLVIEVGVDQVEQVAGLMAPHGLVLHEVVHDGDGDPSGVCASLGGTSRSVGANSVRLSVLYERLSLLITAR